MDLGIILTSLGLGLVASLSCLGFCIPILVPYIMEKDKTPKEGFYTSIFFSVGRLIIYLGIGLVVFAIGSSVTENIPEVWLKISGLILGIVVMIYGAWIYFKFQKPKWCPAKLTPHIRPMFSVMLGVLIGSFFCPLLWITLVGATTLSGDFLTLILSVFAFWIGSSTSIVVAGTISGEGGGRLGKKIGLEKLRELMGMVLIMVGIFYLFRGLIL